MRVDIAKEDFKDDVKQDGGQNTTLRDTDLLRE
jgi:hypothetical protein